MLADVFWEVATSNFVLITLAIVLAVALVVAHVPMIRWLPAIGQYVLLAQLVAYVAIALLAFLIGTRLSDDRAETRRLKTDLAWSQFQLEQQQATAEYSGRLAEQARQKADELQGKVNEYQDALAKLPPGACNLDDTDLGRLRGIAR